MKDIFNLDGKTAIITGASSGLGKHFSKTLSAAGANLVICARRMQNLEKLKDQIDGEVLVLPLDVTSEESVLAKCLPRPEDAPVIIAVFPSKLNISFIIILYFLVISPLLLSSYLDGVEALADQGFR